VLVAVEATPASPVLAPLAASTAPPRTAVGAGYGSQAAKPNNERSFTMIYELEELSLDLIDALVPLMPRIKQRDKALEDQLRRAASSIGLNCAGGDVGPGKQACAVPYGRGQRARDACWCRWRMSTPCGRA
jgi:hypothetical protein